MTQPAWGTASKPCLNGENAGKPRGPRSLARLLDRHETDPQMRSEAAEHGRSVLWAARSGLRVAALRSRW